MQNKRIGQITFGVTSIQYHEIVITRDITRFSTPEKQVSWVWIMSVSSPIMKFSLRGKDEGWKQERRMNTNSAASRLNRSIISN